MTISLIRKDKATQEIVITKRKVAKAVIKAGVMGVAVACVPVFPKCYRFSKAVYAFRTF